MAGTAIGMLRLRSEDRFAILTAALSMTEAYIVGSEFREQEETLPLGREGGQSSDQWIRRGRRCRPGSLWGL